MQAAEFKSILSTLVLPPAGPLLLALLGLLLMLRWHRAGTAVAFTGVLVALALSTNAVALILVHALLPLPDPVRQDQLKGVQAIVVLGGGVQAVAPEYGEAQPAGGTLARLRYGLWLAKRTGLPVAFSGGVGWSATGTPTTPEGTVARRVARQDFGRELRWVDDRSRDTAENAERTAALLRPEGIHRIALVTDSWHMPRSVAHFRAQGFDVVMAPTGFPRWQERPLMEWLPSVHGLGTSRMALREWLGMKLAAPR
ncbi:YdcF family protein [Caenimonas sedimenti]|uniref:YdcF family protein n=1 Tax=Caenimonas sedimenti TaxID=2596921 RepID=A0A562ZXN4_9BURK|nr:YdcF family protein [Caenimonas sedimenti]TWO73045.1 YdcF family protein [Caenimonas sedimenti]